VTSIGWYEANAEDFFARSIGVALLPQMAAFTALLPLGGRVLDAGCGSGRDAKALKEMGFQVTATEASAKLAALAATHSGVDVGVMTFDQMMWREAFDGIWACASLLHVPRNALPATLRRLRAALAPGGVWFMSFKYGRQEREANGRRFTDLDEGTAARLLDETGGLELISIEVSGDVRPGRDQERWLSILCRRS
jgi:SAM-dependent methyltransferase